jgi:hypothetical protein
MKKLTITLFLTGSLGITFGQTNTFPSSGSVGIGTTIPAASSLLEIKSTSKGILIPRMTKAQRDVITSPATGLLLYQTNNTPGFYYYTGNSWIALKPANASKKLDNLTGPTAINTSLLPDTNNTIDLGSVSNSWKDIYFNGSLWLAGSRILNIPDGTVQESDTIPLPIIPLAVTISL